MSESIVLLDPSLRNNNGDDSINLGDVIIYQAVSMILEELFPGMEIHRISTHVFPGKKEIDRIRTAGKVLVGGTNLLSSHIREYNQWKLHASMFRVLFPERIRAILMGVGWWQYQNQSDWLTRHYYRRILDPECTHAVRDAYTLEKMKIMGLHNVVNTSCPTVWNFDGADPGYVAKPPERVLFTLTDYYPNQSFDSLLIEKLLASGSDLVYFPQGTRDEVYLKSLEIFRKNAARVCILPRNLNVIAELAKSDLVYIGTRLHVGIYCLGLGVPSLILAIDNRAMEMSKDIRLPVIRRDEAGKIDEWLNGKLRFGPLSVPVEQISTWKRQFTKADRVAGRTDSLPDCTGA